MANSLTLKLACMVMVTAMIIPSEAMKCGQFSDVFSGCLYYGKGLEEDRIACCRSIDALREADTTVEAQRDSCHCMVGVINIEMVNPNFPFVPSTMGGLFQWCRTFLPYGISSTASCESIGQRTETAI